MSGGKLFLLFLLVLIILCLVRMFCSFLCFIGKNYDVLFKVWIRIEVVFWVIVVENEFVLVLGLYCLVWFLNVYIEIGICFIGVGKFFILDNVVLFLIILVVVVFGGSVLVMDWYFVSVMVIIKKMVFFMCFFI